MEDGMNKEVYKQHLREAQQELVKLLEERTALDQRIAQLRQDIGSLAHLSGAGETGLVMRLAWSAKEKVGLKAACREALRASDEPLTPAEVVERMERLGIHHDDAGNLLASVHTTLRRM